MKGISGEYISVHEDMKNLVVGRVSVLSTQTKDRGKIFKERNKI
jgi:hypothetical protein